MIVLDTNVVAELAAPETDPNVASWILRQRDEDIYITAATLSELVEGVMQLPDGRRKNELDDRIVEAVEDFYDRTLDFTANAAVTYGRFVPDRFSIGRPIERADAEIAACCLQFGATLATRNVKDFEGIPGLGVINPWVID
ncbi:MAG: type II toxin-antitoxin system VapC family toxin [Thermoleophilaceae bacterium]|nr:type II toxin-antitoxin system VapC family toxin [Thermoleophilaceae bacterium]